VERRAKGEKNKIDGKGREKREGNLVDVRTVIGGRGNDN